MLSAVCLASLGIAAHQAPRGDALSCAPPGCGPLCKGNPATVVGSDGRDHLVGTRRRDVVAAGEGDDSVSGRGAPDLICGGGGDDELAGGTGSDGTIARCPPCAQPYPPASGVFGGRGRDMVRGGTGDDDLFGGRRADVLAGDADTDLCRGGPPRGGVAPGDVAKACEYVHGVP
jgi:hypothetical protein